MPAREWNTDAVRDQIGDFLDDVLDCSELDVDFEIRDGGGDAFELVTPELTVDFSGPDLEMLLDHRGELMLALEQLTLEMLHVSHEDRYKILFDAQDYRLMRIEELKLSAEAAADRVRRSGRPFHFQPMTSRERRILHLALRDIPDVESISEGMAPRRHTVVQPVKR